MKGTPRLGRGVLLGGLLVVAAGLFGVVLLAKRPGVVGRAPERPTAQVTKARPSGVRFGSWQSEAAPADGEVLALAVPNAQVAQDVVVSPAAKEQMRAEVAELAAKYPGIALGAFTCEPPPCRAGADSSVLAIMQSFVNEAQTRFGVRWSAVTETHVDDNGAAAHVSFQILPPGTATPLPGTNSL